MKKKVIAGIVLAVVALSLVLAVTMKPGGGNAAGAGSRKGEVGIIYIDGTIMNGRSGGGLLGQQQSSEEIAATLREASRNPAIKAVVIRLNSPGGSAAAAQEISAEVGRLKKSGKIVVASMGDTAASAAYWIASGTDKIVANPGTLTGSIGVIMEFYDLQELYGKIGVDTETFKSGPYKDMGSSSRPATNDERAIFQAMIDDVYSQFLEAVAAGRDRDVSEIRLLADGRVLTGRQAKELGLVDQLGDFHEAVLLAGNLAGIPGEPYTVELGPRSFFSQIFGGAGANTFWAPLWSSLFYQQEASQSLHLR